MQSANMDACTRRDNHLSTESWHSSWDQRTASPLRARRGQGLRDLCFTDLQLGCFTHQHPLRTGRRQPQDDPTHCFSVNRFKLKP
ncbi:hypothetical protein PFLUV_G00100180 [Perca fluviatilis]|uniref:Uncharacterized protein n=1 Tax=Perca fluviatilis TaxID=8168 RepID=A0A6A5ECN6_PERFL|nr:hypothetical protein PFLUV_G00100180 [Perca fluviatilis]